jgi:4,5-dihydroxyphthalate decarboxylase
MPKPVLKTVTRTQGNNQALKDGSVRPETFDFGFEEIPVLVDGFRRMVRGLEFDVCEMAITTYLCAREHGSPFTALPIFLVRGFHHGAIVADTRAGLGSPKDLEGRRVGVNRGYTVTTGVWVRGVLATEYGVDLDKVTWVLSGDEHVADYRPPANVEPMPGDTTLPRLLAEGDLAAAISVSWDDPAAAPLIPDAEAAGFEALRSRGHYPINHLVVVKDSLLAEHPDLALDVFTTFAEAKRRYVRRLRDGEIESPTKVDRMHRAVMDITGDDPLPYGIEPNRAVIEELVDHAMAQHILRDRPSVESLFAAGTLDVSA